MNVQIAFSALNDHEYVCYCIARVCPAHYVHHHIVNDIGIAACGFDDSILLVLWLVQR